MEHLELESVKRPNLLSKITKKGVITVLGAVAICTVAADSLWDSWFNAGEFKVYPPIDPAEVVIDEHLNVGTWNMQKRACEKAKEIKQVYDENSLDLLTLQEVPMSQVKCIRTEMKTKYTTVIRSDGRKEFSNGGIGIVVFTDQRPEEESARIITGESILSFTVNALKGSFPKGDTLEDRAAIGMDIKVKVENGFETVRATSVHISGDRRIRTKQLNKAFDYSNESTVKKKIFLGDTNTFPIHGKKAYTDLHRGRAIVVFNKDSENLPSGYLNEAVKRGYTTTLTDITTTEGEIRDYVSHAGFLGIPNVFVDFRHSTDHYPVIGEFGPKNFMPTSNQILFPKLSDGRLAICC